MTCLKLNLRLIILINDLCRSWKLVGGAGSRHPNGMLGLLIKKHYPGLVTCDDGTKAVPWHWPDFFKVRDEYEVPIGTKIKREFWVSLHCTALSILRIRWTFLK